MQLPRQILRLLLAAAVLTMGCQSEKIDNTMLVDPDGPVSFSEDVLPIFIATCGNSSCHLEQTTSGVNLSSYEQVMGSIGVQYGERIVIPGDAMGSPLIDKLGPSPQFGIQMPMGRQPLSPQEVARIQAWIDDGAPDN